MLRSWPLREQIPFFENELGIPLAEEAESAKLFPASNRARDVRDALLALARRRGVALMMDTLVTGLAPTAEGWSIERAGAPPIEARSGHRRHRRTLRPEIGQRRPRACRSSRSSATRFTRRIPR